MLESSSPKQAVTDRLSSDIANKFFHYIKKSISENSRELPSLQKLFLVQDFAFLQTLVDLNAVKKTIQVMPKDELMPLIFEIISYKNLSSLKFIVDNCGIRLNKKYFFNDFNLLQLACFTGDHNTIAYLIEKGFNVNERGHNGIPPLNIVVYSNASESVVELLFKKELNPNLTDKKGQTALHIAHLINPHLAPILRKYGVKQETKDNEGCTYLNMLGRKNLEKKLVGNMQLITTTFQAKRLEDYCPPSSPAIGKAIAAYYKFFLSEDFNYEQLEIIIKEFEKNLNNNLPNDVLRAYLECVCASNNFERKGSQQIVINLVHLYPQARYNIVKWLSTYIDFVLENNEKEIAKDLCDLVRVISLPIQGTSVKARINLFLSHVYFKLGIFEHASNCAKSGIEMLDKGEHKISLLTNQVEQSSAGDFEIDYKLSNMVLSEYEILENLYFVLARSQYQLSMYKEASNAFHSLLSTGKYYNCPEIVGLFAISRFKENSNQSSFEIEESLKSIAPEIALYYRTHRTYKELSYEEFYKNILVVLEYGKEVEALFEELTRSFTYMAGEICGNVQLYNFATNLYNTYPELLSKSKVFMTSLLMSLLIERNYVKFDEFIDSVVELYKQNSTVDEKAQLVKILTAVSYNLLDKYFAEKVKEVKVEGYISIKNYIEDLLTISKYINYILSMNRNYKISINFIEVIMQAIVEAKEYLNLCVQNNKIDEQEFSPITHFLEYHRTKFGTVVLAKPFEEDEEMLNFLPPIAQRYFQAKKKSTLETSVKDDKPSQPMKSWVIKGTEINDKNTSLKSFRLKSKYYYAYIDPKLELDKKQYELVIKALSKGECCRATGENGVKIVNGALIEIKINADLRIYTSNIYQNEEGDMLVIFDKKGNHEKISKEANGSQIRILSVESSLDKRDVSSGGFVDRIQKSSQGTIRRV